MKSITEEELFLYQLSTDKEIEFINSKDVDVIDNETRLFNLSTDVILIYMITYLNRQVRYDISRTNGQLHIVHHRLEYP